MPHAALVDRAAVRGQLRDALATLRVLRQMLDAGHLTKTERDQIREAREKALGEIRSALTLLAP